MTMHPHSPAFSVADERHGPGTPATLRPGERGSVLVISPPGPPEEAMADAVGWITAFEQDCGLVLESDATSLYAVATVDQLVRASGGLAGEAAAAHLDFVLADGVWHHRGTCLPAPHGGGTSAWAWQVHRLQTGAPAGSLATVWDVYPLPAA